LQRAILENPDYDAPRLAWADWHAARVEDMEAAEMRKCILPRPVLDISFCSPCHGRGIFRRGFIESITLTAEDFLAHLAALFGTFPITAVRFDDLGSFVHTDGADHWYWFEPVDGTEFDNDDKLRATLPRELYDALDGRPLLDDRASRKEYPTREAALAALSRAAVLIGRKAAGLPPLTAFVEPVTIEEK
jgi:uncharacterized protein (TIGR02996 family)